VAPRLANSVAVFRGSVSIKRLFLSISESISFSDKNAKDVTLYNDTVIETVDGERTN